MSSYPKVSIITVVLNRKSEFKKTMRSVSGQTYPNIEYIVVDGGSKDGTLDIIKSAGEKICVWISEPDRGIYDAMNKGLKLATGEYVWFMNAGDEVYSKEVLREIYDANPDCDVYYGDTELINDKGGSLGLRTLKKPPRSMTWRSMKYGMMIGHQSTIFRKSAVSEYDIKYRYCADIDWTIRGLKNCAKIVNTGKVLSKYLVGGFSKVNTVESIKERFIILKTHFGLIPNLINHVPISFRFLISVIRKEQIT